MWLFKGASSKNAGSEDAAGAAPPPAGRAPSGRTPPPAAATSVPATRRSSAVPSGGGGGNSAAGAPLKSGLRPTPNKRESTRQSTRQSTRAAAPAKRESTWQSPIDRAARENNDRKVTPEKLARVTAWIETELGEPLGAPLAVALKDGQVGFHPRGIRSLSRARAIRREDHSPLFLMRQTARRVVDAALELTTTLRRRLTHNKQRDARLATQVLCRLINHLRPGTIPKISKAAAAFLQLNNITQFLRAARKLGVKDSECFDTTDLYEQKDLNAVITCLLSLRDCVESPSFSRAPAPAPAPAAAGGPAPKKASPTAGRRSSAELAPPQIAGASSTRAAPSWSQTSSRAAPSLSAHGRDSSGRTSSASAAGGVFSSTGSLSQAATARSPSDSVRMSEENVSTGKKAFETDKLSKVRWWFVGCSVHHATKRPRVALHRIGRRECHLVGLTCCAPLAPTRLGRACAIARVGQGHALDRGVPRRAARVRQARRSAARRPAALPAAQRAQARHDPKGRS